MTERERGETFNYQFDNYNCATFFLMLPQHAQVLWAAPIANAGCVLACCWTNGHVLAIISMGHDSLSYAHNGRENWLNEFVQIVLCNCKKRTTLAHQYINNIKFK